MPRVGWTPSLEPKRDRAPAADPWKHLKLPDSVSSSQPDTRGAIERTAVEYRQGVAQGGVEITHDAAVDRVRAARIRGDRAREDHNR
jgi:hypothetical protein